MRRTKDEVLKDALPMKDERIVFCEPSELQKLIYQHILEQPDFVLLRYVQ
jgi:SNF2 family DNA or RNA helicase